MPLVLRGLEYYDAFGSMMVDGVHCVPNGFATGVVKVLNVDLNREKDASHWSSVKNCTFLSGGSRWARVYE